MKWLKRILLALLVLFLLAQFVRPDRTNPPVDSAKELRAPAPVQQILERSCYDCHSHRTTWPWYSHITPAGQYLADHVEEGREHLSFSEFLTYPPKKAAKKFEELCEEVEEGHMPLREYLWLHPSARLSEEDKRTLCTWAKTEHQRLLTGS